MKYFLWLLKAAIFFTLFAFALNNQHDASVRWFFGLFSNKQDPSKPFRDVTSQIAQNGMNSWIQDSPPTASSLAGAFWPPPWQLPART